MDPKIVIKSYMKKGTLKICCGDNEHECIEVESDDSVLAQNGTSEPQQPSPRDRDPGARPAGEDTGWRPITGPRTGGGVVIGYIARERPLRGMDELISRCEQLRASLPESFADFRWNENNEGMIVFNVTHLPIFEMKRAEVMRELSVRMRSTIFVRVFD
jgi:hypothetical protein